MADATEDPTAPASSLAPSTTVTTATSTAMNADPTPAPTVARAEIMLWPNLQDTEGTSVSTTWDELFSTWEDPPRFAGDTRHGGWSACICEPPHRAATNVCGLSALVLDYDNGTPLDDACGTWREYMGALHTSRSHTAEKPRFRIVLPFSRIVTPDEYAILWRWAQKLSAAEGHRIDPACKDVARFWFRPARTAAYETRRLLGDRAIDADMIIAAHKYEEHERQRAAQAQRQPSTDVEKRALRYLEKLPASISGSGGHGALWTAALALVRGFRITPARALQMLKTEFNPRCQPPWSERELRHKVEGAEQDATTEYGYLADRVRAVVTRADGPRATTPEPPPDADPDYVPAVPADFVDEPFAAPGPGTPTAPRVASAANWRATLHTSPNGHVKNTFDNICKILEHHENYGPKLAYDEMRVTPMLGDRRIGDADVGRIRREIEQHFGFQPSEANVRAAIGTVADQRRFHPVRRYLEGLTWDQTPRIDRVVPDVLRADDTAIHRALVRKWFIAAVKRALNPGCQVDELLVLVGEQGWRKSTFFRTLGGEWFSDTFMDITGKDSLLQLHSAWIYEWGEIERITTERQASIVKGFASSTSDDFRAPFARTVETHPRTTVVVGSTNSDQFLVDPTGNRRFHCVKVGGKVGIDWVVTHRDQLWAEAVAAARAGEQTYLTEQESAERDRINEDFLVEDAWTQPMQEWLAVPRMLVTMHDILTKAVGLQPGQINRAAENRAGAALRRLGWVRRKVRQGSATMWTWKREGTGHDAV